MSKIVQNAIITPDGTALVSSYRHDYQEYTDKNGKTYMVDGGMDYCRRRYQDDFEELALTSDMDFDIIRNKLLWGSYGINGDEPLHHIRLKDMDTNHVYKVRDIFIQVENPNFYQKFRYDMYTQEIDYRYERESDRGN